MELNLMSLLKEGAIDLADLEDFSPELRDKLTQWVNEG